MIRITERRTPHVYMEAMQSTSWPTADETFPDAHLTACDLHCNGATAAWRGMLVMLHGVTGGPATSRGLEICCPVYGHGGIHYSTVVKDNSRVSTDHGPLTR